jgi:hypothetical protein
MVFCEVCQINTPNMKSHSKSKKHQNGGKREGMTEEQLKEYHKRYYIEHNLKDKYKEKKKCEVCDKMVAKYNWSKHIQTEKHFKKQHEINNPEQPYVRERLIKDDKNNEDIIDPLTVKEEDIVFSDSDSEDEIGEVMKEIMEIEKSDNDEKPKNKIKKSTKKFEIS